MSELVDHGAAILAWLASTERYLILEGDSAKVAPSIPDASIDAIVADPPAGIAFMGKAWDEDKGGESEWIAWLAGILTDAFRALKPGGHCLLWALPRTSDWTMQALRRAGFEVRDVVTHLFGCLSEDTEILIDGRWEPYQKAVVGSLAMCYDLERDEYFWGPIQETFEYPYADTAFRIRSAGTDQIVSRGHRCIVERDGAFGFERAEDVALDRSARVPVLEGLPDLLRDLPVSHERGGGAQRDVRSEVRRARDGGEDDRRASEAFPDVRDVRRGVSTEGQSCSEQSQVLHYEVRRGGSNEQARRSGAASGDSAARICRLDRREPGELHAEDERREQSRLEGRSHVPQPARQLRGDEVCPVPAGVPEHGAQGRVCDGAPPRGRAGDGAHVDPSGDGSPRGPQPDEQRDREPAPLRDEPRSQAVRGARYTRSDLATIEPVRYDGIVWCVRVSTGAFVARRNGKVFVTGNSGFPKSLDVAKAIDARRVDDIRPVCRFLRAAMNAAGLSSSDISARFGFHSRMVDHWAARDTDSQPTVPTPEQWEQLRGLLGFGAEMDAEVDRLNGRKGERGEAWANREIVGEHEGTTPGLPGMRFGAESKNITAPSLPEARRWSGFGTAIKPAAEFWILARKPLGSTVAECVLAHGTGALNIDAARVASAEPIPTFTASHSDRFIDREDGVKIARTGETRTNGRFPANLVLSHTAWEETHCRPCGAVLSFVARFCPECGSGAVEHRRAGCCAVGEREAQRNVVTGERRDSFSVCAYGDGLNGNSTTGSTETVTAWECLATCQACGLSTLALSGGAPPRCRCGRAMSWACAVARLDEQSGETTTGDRSAGSGGSLGYMGGASSNGGPASVGDSGGASRFFNTFAPPDDVEPFFWCAKPSAAETEAGCEALPLKSAAEVTDREEGSAGSKHARAGATHGGRRNHHPTRKSIALMRHFCRLVCPPGGIVLDLFAGSGTTIGAWGLEGGRAIGIEMDPEFAAIARARAAFWGRMVGTKAATVAKPRPTREKVDSGQGRLF